MPSNRVRVPRGKRIGAAIVVYEAEHAGEDDYEVAPERNQHVGRPKYTGGGEISRRHLRFRGRRYARESVGTKSSWIGL
jgi:hypothetical protein